MLHFALCLCPLPSFRSAIELGTIVPVMSLVCPLSTPMFPSSPPYLCIVYETLLHSPNPYHTCAPPRHPCPSNLDRTRGVKKRY
uniref:Secreted protein n=1 Tax=Echinococcus granulosus TaxID=6210 RepID=A0A068WN69_ECHGR|nr:hypothetical protein EgrG_000209200 [Echinococcus granulosus]